MSTQRRPVQSSLLLLAGLFVVAAAIGYGVSRLAPGSPVHRIADTEYVSVVAQLFLHDHDASLARERLAVLGSPQDAVQRAVVDAQAGHLTTPNDRAAIDALSAALNAPATGSASRTDATSGTATTSGTESESRLSLIGPLVAFFLALGLGFLVLARTAGVNVSGLRLPFQVGATRPRPTKPLASPRRGAGSLHSTESRGGSSVAISEVSLGDEPTDVDVVEPPVTRATTVRRARSAQPRTRRPLVFQSHYRLGDDPFEEIHPISDPRTGGLIAACGLTATLHLDSNRAGGYYAFTGWIQDYAGSDDLHAAGFVSPGATEFARASIDSWVRSGQIDAVVSLERGAEATVGNDDLKATLTVVDVAYADNPKATDAYVTSLLVRFEIQLSDGDRAAELSEPATTRRL
jgi:hypothetical protein